MKIINSNLQLMIDLIRKAPIESILKSTNYSRVLDTNELKKAGCEFDIDNYGDIQINLNPENKQSLIKFFQSIDFLPTEQNHIYHQSKRIFESYDNLSVIAHVSNDFKMDKEYYKNHGLEI